MNRAIPSVSTEQKRTDIPALQPLDEFNRELQANVHPTDWRNPTPTGRYNLVVIGAGTAGLVTAAGAAGLGAKVALIERDLMGGDCLNVGCVPSKALIRSARAYADIRDAERFGVNVPDGYAVNFPAVMKRMRQLRAGISPHDSAKRFQSLGIDVFIGEARFTGTDSVAVNDTVLRFSRACIATGARAMAPPIEGLEQAGYLTNETVFSLTELPKRLAVIGAGPIGCEMAQSFARFGSQVTLLEADRQNLPREDTDAAEIVRRSLEKDGIKIICGGKTAKVETDSTGSKIIHAECDAKPHRIEVDEILVGVGRAPNVELNLEAANVAYDRKTGVIVDDRLRTSNRRVYAAGDVCSRYKFTHAADAMARIVIQNALFFGRAKVSSLVIPWCTYTDPEIAHVGLYPAEAEKQGIEINTFRIDMSTVDRAILEGDTEGLLKVHVRKGTDKIVGATLVSKHAGESISQLTLAITAGIGLGTIGKTIHPYPTQAEAIKKAADAYSRTRLTPGVKKLFELVLAWRR
ncbi:MAG: mercuric reductase [Phycisphaeraceae bacterium]